MEFISQDILDDHAYMDYIADLITDDKLQSMDQIIHHYHTTRLRHSLSVSYIAYKFAQAKGLQEKSVARAGLLHDFFLESRDEIAALDMGSHAIAHPKIALENAKDLTSISNLEADIILTHMYMSCLKSPRPKSKEAFLVSLVDKQCAVTEFMTPTYQYVQNGLQLIKNRWASNL